MNNADLSRIIHEIIKDYYMPALRHEIAEIINEKQPLLLTEEKQKYLEKLLEAQRSSHECHKEIDDVIRDLHKSYGYTK